ncbi:MAG TPA: beta-eliminating lyase-related protein, partial [Actinomycetota bacterium]|nr:beta-eliminating lyase-related protein [Actinomycetota bacterium]
MLGGGMRQVGVIAAAARVAVDSMVDRLHDDHVNARRLADGIASFWGDAIDPASVETNIVYLECGERDPLEIIRRVGERGVKVAPMTRGRIRCVTHKDVDAAGVERAIEAFKAAI